MDLSEGWHGKLGLDTCTLYAGHLECYEDILAGKDELMDLWSLPQSLQDLRERKMRKFDRLRKKN